MRILMIAPQPFYAERGTPMNVRLICKVLGEAGHQVDLLVFPTGKKIELKNLRIIRLPNIFKVKSIPVGPSKIKLAFDFLLVAAAFLLVATKKYDVIHGIEEGGFVAVILSKLFRRVSIYDMDSCVSEQLRYGGHIKNQLLLNLVANLEKWSIQGSSAVITVCQSLSDKAKSISLGANICQIEDIPVLNSNKYVNELVEELIEKFNLSDSMRVLYTGNLESYQGIDLLIESWNFFCAQKTNSRNYKLVIVGGNDNQIDHYKRITAGKGLSGSVCWVGQRPSEEMSAWMCISHVLVSPRSEGDNTPLKIYSYMAAGRPIVATRLRTHTQVLDDSMAFLSEVDPVQFGNAIYLALNKPELALQKAIKAKCEVEIKYSFNVFKRKLLDLYTHIND